MKWYSLVYDIWWTNVPFNVKSFQEISKDIMKILCFDNCCKYTLRINYQKIILQISPQWKHGSSWNSVCQYITTLKSISVNFQKDLYFHYWDIWKMISLINFNFQCIVPTFIKKRQTFQDISGNVLKALYIKGRFNRGITNNVYSKWPCKNKDEGLCTIINIQSPLFDSPILS